MESNRNRDQLNLLKEGNGFFLKEQNNCANNCTNVITHSTAIGGSTVTEVDRKGGQKNPKVDRKGGQKTREAILSLIAENPQITSTQMAERLGINRSAISKHLKRMQAEGVVRRIGPDKGGHWEVDHKTNG